MESQKLKARKITQRSILQNKKGITER